MNSGKRCDAAFKQSILLKSYDALEAAGFTRYRKHGVDWPMENGFHCWVGLNSALESEYVEINPFVGVHVVPVEKLATIKEGRKYDRSVATYAVHMGKLAPDERAFRFTKDIDITEEAQRLAQFYVDVGLTYALTIGNYEILLPLLQERVPMLGGYPESTAACLYLMGKKDEARSFVENFLGGHEEYFLSFAGPFLKLLESQR
jgi:hypothetical protein